VLLFFLMVLLPFYFLGPESSYWIGVQWSLSLASCPSPPQDRPFLPFFFLSCRPTRNVLISLGLVFPQSLPRTFPPHRVPSPRPRPGCENPTPLNFSPPQFPCPSFYHLGNPGPPADPSFSFNDGFDFLNFKDTALSTGSPLVCDLPPPSIRLPQRFAGFMCRHLSGSPRRTYSPRAPSATFTENTPPQDKISLFSRCPDDPAGAFSLKHSPPFACHLSRKIIGLHDPGAA